MELQATNIEYPCIVCQQEVRPGQEAIQCDDCHKWQHRTCGTGYSRADYRQAVRQGTDIPFSCVPCRQAVNVFQIVLLNQGGDIYM